MGSALKILPIIYYKTIKVNLSLGATRAACEPPPKGGFGSKPRFAHPAGLSATSHRYDIKYLHRIKHSGAA